MTGVSLRVNQRREIRKNQNRKLSSKGKGRNGGSGSRKK